MAKTRRVSNAIVILDTLVKCVNVTLVLAAMRVIQLQSAGMEGSVKTSTFLLVTSVIARQILREKNVN